MAPTREDLARQLLMLEQETKRRANYKFRRYFPDEGPLARSKYRKHLAFFEAGKTFLERLFLAANRIGKTDAGAFEITCHMTGLYPTWWPGRRFTTAGEWWAAGTTATTTRDILQKALYGPPEKPRTGMLPAHLIVDKTPRPGTPDALGSIQVRHITGEIASMYFKSYDQGRASFQGTEKQGVWLDEEPPPEIEEESLLRTMTTDGMVIITFTPLEGLTPFVQSYLETCVMVSDDLGVVSAKENFWTQTLQADVPAES